MRLGRMPVSFLGMLGRSRMVALVVMFGSRPMRLGRGFVMLGGFGVS